MENHTLQLTKMENEVLTTLIDNLYAEPGFSDIDANDLSKKTNIPMKSIRGVISSLVKKEIISLEEHDNAFSDKQYIIIYLNEAFYYLHPEWKNFNQN